jgi:hypothetical protein
MRSSSVVHSKGGAFSAHDAVLSLGCALARTEYAWALLEGIMCLVQVLLVVTMVRTIPLEHSNNSVREALFGYERNDVAGKLHVAPH